MAITRSLIEIAPSYLAMRAKYPSVPAVKIHAYLHSDTGESFEEFCCPGHEWAFTGTAYGGDDERWCGEGRCYCINCGADGDA
jgi:hypothetical protein